MTISFSFLLIINNNNNNNYTKRKEPTKQQEKNAGGLARIPILPRTRPSPWRPWSSRSSGTPRRTSPSCSRGANPSPCAPRLSSRPTWLASGRVGSSSSCLTLTWEWEQLGSASEPSRVDSELLPSFVNARKGRKCLGKCGRGQERHDFFSFVLLCKSSAVVFLVFSNFFLLHYMEFNLINFNVFSFSSS